MKAEYSDWGWVATSLSLGTQTGMVMKSAVRGLVCALAVVAAVGCGGDAGAKPRPPSVEIPGGPPSVKPEELKNNAEYMKRTSGQSGAK